MIFPLKWDIGHLISFISLLLRLTSNLWIIIDNKKIAILFLKLQVDSAYCSTRNTEPTNWCKGQMQQCHHAPLPSGSSVLEFLLVSRFTGICPYRGICRCPSSWAMWSSWLLAMQGSLSLASVTILLLNCFVSSPFSSQSCCRQEHPLGNCRPSQGVSHAQWRKNDSLSMPFCHSPWSTLIFLVRSKLYSIILTF